MFNQTNQLPPATLACWTGKVVCSPTSPPTGGCATRVLVEMDGVDDVCDVYHLRQPTDARRLEAFAKMCRLRLVGNV